MSEYQDYVPPGSPEPAAVAFDYIPPGKTEEQMKSARKEFIKGITANPNLDEGEKTAYQFANSMMRAEVRGPVQIGVPIHVKDMTASVKTKDVLKEQEKVLESKGSL